MSAVDESLREIDFPSVVEVLRECGENTVEDTFALPLLEAPMARLIRRIPARQVRPRRSGAKDPQHAVQHVARIAPRPPALLRRGDLLGLGKMRSNRFPLFVGE